MKDSINKNNYTYNEISRQQDIWVKVLESLGNEKTEFLEILKKYRDRKWIFTGCGTSYYLAQTGSYLFGLLTGIETSSLPSSEIIMFHKDIIKNDAQYLLVPISRSGTSTEVVKAVQTIKAHFDDIPILSVSCDSNSAMVKESGYKVTFPFEKEQSVVMTGSFTTMLLSIVYVASLLGNNEAINSNIKNIAHASKEHMQKYESYIKKIAQNPEISQFVFLGQGPFYGIANESALKIQEMSLSAANSYHALEYRHGPMSTASENTLITIFNSENGDSYEKELINNLKNLGVKILYLRRNSISDFTDDSIYVVDTLTNYSDTFNPFIYMPLMHLLGYYKAVSKNLDSDKPKNLSAVVTF